MTGLRRALVALGVVGFVAGAVPLALALASEGGHQRTLLAIFGPLTGWAFVGTGIFAWLRRPESRVGALMTAVGFSACLAALRVSTEPWVFIVGLLFITLQWALLYHLLLAFPGGALRNGFERALVAATYASAALAHPFGVLFQDTAAAGLPANPLLIEGEPELTRTLSEVRFGLGIALLVALAVILAGRWRAAPRSERRALAGVLLSGGTVMALLGAWYAAILVDADPGLVEGLEEARVVLLATVPFAFLAGLLRIRVAGAAALGGLVARLGEPRERRGQLRDALAEALGDPSLAIAFWLPERREFVDAAGRTVAVPPPQPGRAWTPVESRGKRVAAILHDAALADERELVRSAGAAASLALENERLDAELRAKVEELRASRARIVESADAARRRLERDLHDGAQQRLVSLALRLRMLDGELDGGEARAELDAARAELDGALEELRELARGLHPSVLSDRGLGPALEGLASRAPFAVELDAALGERLAEPVESTAYYVVAEALTNAAKYARASRALVRVRHENGGLRVEIADDGIGGADPDGGTGLRGLVDRVAALEGRLEVSSEPGAGTTVRATIPC